MSIPIGHDVAHAAALLKSNELVAIPTETVYGLGANGLSPNAVAKIFAAKNRPFFDPLILHVAQFSAIEQLVQTVPSQAKLLAEAFCPGPLTLVLPKSNLVPDIVTSGLPNVAIRIPQHPLALELLRAVDIPVAAPSANLFGQLSPTTAKHVADQLGEDVSYILDGGPCSIGVESTVLQLAIDEKTPPLLLRLGGMTLEQIEEVIGEVAIPNPKAHPSTMAQPAPGMLPKHYAPQKPLLLVKEIESYLPDCPTGLLTLQSVPNIERFTAVEVLSESGDLIEATAHFFAALHRLQKMEIEQIIAVPFPEKGLGRALNDRLARASD
ncbi:Threonylcarbamoyl-AMP synthase / SUA5 domain with internal deletion [hydrothermal vent metagenome]|uniref:Threonylcarbamoyl-AMP synthase n=1 Tax=hydrothermal vent metagenome TaxID=652676 RepID=A0A3B1DHT1_9ZZZZ